MKKKIKLELILIVIGLLIFFISMLFFIINACTVQNVSIAWLLFAFIILGSGLTLWGLILLLIRNKDKIKNYLNEIL